MTDTRPTATSVTDEQLAEMGFPVRKTDKVVGTLVVTRKGTSRHEAVWGAWAAGKVRMAVAAAPEGDLTWADLHGKPRPGADPEVTAWAVATRRKLVSA